MKIAVLTGAGVSRESGLETFRDAGGLWEGYRPEEVATPEALANDPEMVHRFYDMRRRASREAQPNAGHLAIAELERDHEVTIITQNIDDLHERAGSTKVIHLHGEVLKARPHGPEYTDADLVPWTEDLPAGDLRPHVVFFGEAVPLIVAADEVVREADLLLIVGTSLQIYPAAGLVMTALRRRGSPARVVLIDPAPVNAPSSVEVISEPATTGVRKFVDSLEESSGEQYRLRES